MTPLAKLMGGSIRYYVARNRIDQTWEVRAYLDDAIISGCYDTQDEADEAMRELDAGN